MEDGNIANKVVIDDHITVIDGDNTTTITGDAVSTTKLSGTLDAESMKNSLTAEAVQNVIPMAWSVGDSGALVDANNDGGLAIGKAARSIGNSGIAIGKNSHGHSWGIGIGQHAICHQNYAIVIGYNAGHGGENGIAIGTFANGGIPYSRMNAIVIGNRTKCSANNTITFGAQFTETTDSGNVTHTCTTEGTGSITIGAGANTLNTTNSDGTVKESSNSVTIGCKAKNSGADSVVIGASANNISQGNVLIGTGTKSANMTYSNSIAIGKNAVLSNVSVSVGAGTRGGVGGVSVGCDAATDPFSVAVGWRANALGFNAIAVGHNAKANNERSIAIGAYATVNDIGATVIRSTAEDDTYTQLYFSGANTPLAKKYFPTAWEKKQDVDEQGNPKVDENGEPVMVDDKDKPIAGEAMMGFVAKDKDGNIIARGANMLSALFPYYNGDNENPFTPTIMSLDGENQEPIAFHPSDLDMPIEEAPIEEEYKPLPVYPIVEPTIDEITE